MNKIFKIIWSAAHGDWVVASEDERAAKGRRSSLTNARLAGLRLSGVAVALLGVMGVMGVVERAEAQAQPLSLYTIYDAATGVMEVANPSRIDLFSTIPWNPAALAGGVYGSNLTSVTITNASLLLQTGASYSPLDVIFDNSAYPGMANYAISINIGSSSSQSIDLSNYTVTADTAGAGGNFININGGTQIYGSVIGPNSAIATVFNVPNDGIATSIGGDIRAGNGIGINTFNLGGGSVGGNIVGGSANDTFNLSGTRFGGSSTLTTGTGTNTVNLNGAAGSPLIGLAAIIGSGTDNVLNLDNITLTKGAAAAFTHSSGSTNISGFGIVNVNGGGVLNFSGDLFSSLSPSLTGQLDIASGGTVNVLSGGGSITGTLSNSGILNLRSAAPGNTLIINGNYAGGGVVQLNTYLGDASDPAVSDVLVINNGTVTGTTRLDIAATGVGRAGEAGITVVDLQGSSTAANDAFVLGNGTTLQSAGLFSYELTRQNPSLNTSDFILVSAGLSPRVPVYSLSTVAAQSLALSNVGSMRDRGEAYEASTRTSVHDLTKTMDGKYWTRIRYDRIDMKRGDSALDQKEFLFQLGYNLIENYGEANDGVLTRRGFTVGYGDARGDVDGRDYQSDNFRYAGAGKVDTRSYSLGAYQTNFWGNGIYLDLIGQISLLDSKLRDVENHRARTQGWNGHLSTELGRTILFGNGNWRIEPQVQVTLSRTDMDKFNDGEVYVDSVSQDLVRARAGAWLFNNFQTNSGNNTMFYMLANVWHDVTKPNRVKLSDTVDVLQLRPDVVRTWAELGVGFQQTLASSRLTLFGDVRGQHAISAGDRDGYGAQIGVKANW